jgi:transcriptional regulator with XRE-family HTH domain
MKLQTAIGHTIRDIRQEKQLSLRDVCSKAFISVGHLSDVERGAKMASNELLESITIGLGISTTELLKEITDYLTVVNGE